VRSWDNPINGGTGKGVTEFHIEEIAIGLNRSIRTAYRYIKAALAAKFLHSVEAIGDGFLRIKYCSLERIARQLGWPDIGAIAHFKLEDIHLAKVRATEAVAESLIIASRRQMEKQFKNEAEDEPSAFELLSHGSVQARGIVVRRGKRLLYLGPRWHPFGASQKSIGDYLERSERTIQRRFSDEWRKERGIAPLNKAQTAHQIFENLPKEQLKEFVKIAKDDETCANRLVFLGRKLFLVRTNLYLFPEVELRGQRYRRHAYIRTTKALKKVRVQNVAPQTRGLGICSDYKGNTREPEENLVPGVKRAAYTRQN
jgi:hypothetical protein